MTLAIQSITKGPRQSNMELLRIIAMLMVLILHANFSSLGAPHLPLSVDGVVRIGFESLCIVAVDVFVLISGWFSIKASVKGFAAFLFQYFFFLAIPLAYSVLNTPPLSVV